VPTPGEKTAASIAERVHQLAQDKGLNAHLAVLDDYEKLGLLDPAASYYCVVVVSTTGNGDAPKGAEKLVRFVKKRALAGDTLKAVAGFSVLALGDSNYDKFCFVGKQIDARFKALGASQLMPVTCADEVLGLDTVVEPWISKLWPFLLGSQGSPVLAATKSASSTSAVPTLSLGGSGSSTNAAVANALAPRSLFEPRGWQPPLPALALDAKMLAMTAEELIGKAAHPARLLSLNAQAVKAPGEHGEHFSVTLLACTRQAVADDRLVLDLEFALPPKLDWLPGDALAIHVDNPQSLVSAVASRVSGDVPSDRDLAGPPPRTFLRALAEHCADPLDCARLIYLSSSEGKTDYEALVVRQRATVAEALALFPSCRAPAAVLALLPALKPRLYSLASSPLSCAPARVLLSVVTDLVRAGTSSADSGERVVRGLCSHTLNGVAPPHELRAHLHHNPSFHPPADDHMPVILVGPGTGVAPFVGFLQHRVLARQHAAKSQKAAVPASGTWRGGMDFEDELEAAALAEDCETRGTTPPLAMFGGEARLYYGCRNDADFLRRAELETLAVEGEVVLRVAMSRVGTVKRYVQDLLFEDAAQIISLVLNKGAAVFVCGDGTVMAKQVLECFQALLAPPLGGADAAREYVKDMQLRGRYNQDIW